MTCAVVGALVGLAISGAAYFVWQLWELMSAVLKIAMERKTEKRGRRGV